MVLEQVMSDLQQAYLSVVNLFPQSLQFVVPLTITSFFIVIYSLLVWYFYRTLSKRDLLELNLNQYNLTDNSVHYKIKAVTLYILEYIFILPFLVFMWFALLSLVLIFLAEGRDFGTIITFSASLVAAVRILAYYNEKIAEEVAKAFPMTLVVVFLSAFSFQPLENFNSFVGEFWAAGYSIMYYFVFLFGIELLFRLLAEATDFFLSEEDKVKLRNS